MIQVQTTANTKSEAPYERASAHGPKRHELTAAEVEAFGRELDELRERVLAQLGEEDAKYIRRLIRVQKTLDLSGRAMIAGGGFAPPLWFVGVASLGLAKILDNMEIGHNVMHGQYEFLRDPALSAHRFEWDTGCPNEQWRHSHNFMHHTYTNIVNKDRDIGYGVLRLAEDQKWEPFHLANPIIAAWVAVFFQWAVALHDLEVRRQKDEPGFRESIRSRIDNTRRKSIKFILKDYVLFPLLGGPFFFHVLAGNVAANLIRNLWAFTIIFCGHFPLDVEMYTEEEAENETRGEWYLRQILGSANISGGKLMHILTGNLSHQIEHHLFPDVPGHRYAEIAVEVRAICERYGVAYHTGPLSKQFASVIGRIFKYSLPPLGGPAASPA